MSTFAHSLETRAKAVMMVRDGARNADVARELRVPVGTIGWWAHEDRKRYGHQPQRHISTCPRCAPGAVSLNRRMYSYLLGLYLGDGCLCSGAALRKRGIHYLTIACADAWPGLMDECEAAMRAVMPRNAVGRVQRKGMHEVKAYSKHWTRLFPQHGPRMKLFTGEFVRGLIHSDGCRVYNVAVHRRDRRVTRYHYSRCHFTNESTHIRELFTSALDRLGVEWRYNNRNCVSIARQESVKRLDAFVGPKH